MLFLLLTGRQYCCTKERGRESGRNPIYYGAAVRLVLMRNELHKSILQLPFLFKLH